MRKIIIENYTKDPWHVILHHVNKVIEMGRISDGGYCYHTVFVDDVHVSTFKNKKSDRFVVYRKGDIK